VVGRVREANRSGWLPRAPRRERGFWPRARTKSRGHRCCRPAIPARGFVSRRIRHCQPRLTRAGFRTLKGAPGAHEQDVSEHRGIYGTPPVS
jgi:hypothetical protein